jgi:PKD repeat protein
MFLFQGPGGTGAGGQATPPTAAFTSSCSGLTCSFDAGGSTAGSGGGQPSYAWQFGDGSSGTGVSPSHTFASGGSYPVTLTVTSASGTDSVSHTVTVTAPNQLPTASFTASCAGLTCSFDGTGSHDPDGSIAAYAWDFGDGAHGTGATPSHTYPSAGQQTVTLTVTDDRGGTDTTTRSVDPGAATGVQFVAADSANASSANPRVTIPTSVQAGDTLVLCMSVNSTSATVTPPSGWTQVDALDGSNVVGRVWTRTATSADAGSTVVVPLSGTVKSDLSVAAYRGNGGQSAVVAHAGALDQTTGTTHTAPGVTTTASGQWVATYWSEKSSDTVTWSTPASQVVRSQSAGTGGGAIAAVLVDSGGPVPSGPFAGLTATTSVAVSRVVMFTTVIGLQ